MLYLNMKPSNGLISTITRNTISDDATTVRVHNVRSLSKNIDDIVRDNREMNIVIIE